MVRRAAPAFALALAAASLVAVLGLRGQQIDVAWAPSLGLRLTGGLDDLAVLYALLAAGVGLVVLLFSLAYVPRQVAEIDDPRVHGTSFWLWMALFLVAMLVLVCAQDLVVLFVAWDVTAVASYALIGFDRSERARRGAVAAMLLTGATAVLLLAAIGILLAEHGTTSIPRLRELAGAGGVTTGAAVLLAVAALAKSAQAPLHLWLPRAMAAPTPVSAYLHSAAMVAAGVFLLSRVLPLIAGAGALPDVVLGVGLLSVAVGTAIALAGDELKEVLAGSTIAQLGLVTAMLGLGGAAGAVAASLYVLSHAVAKCALFLVAGAVTQLTGEDRLSDMGGLARRTPLLAGAAAVAAASVAALPLTLGFFAHELWFGAAWERGPALGLAAAAASAGSVAYLSRWWWGIFGGPPRATVDRRPPPLLVLPPVALAAVALVGGLWPAPFGELAARAGTTAAGMPGEAQLALHADARVENLLALGALAGGALLVAAGAARERAAAALAALARRAGPARLADGAAAALHAASEALFRRELRDLRVRVGATLVPGAALVLLALVGTAGGGTYTVGGVRGGDLGLLALLVAVLGAAAAVCRQRDHLRLVVALTVLGLSLAATYALLGAADVALVVALVEVLFTLLLLGALSLVPDEARRDRASSRTSRRRGRADVAVAIAAGTAATATVWAALSQPAGEATAARGLVRAAGEAGAGDVVTFTLADARALDTAVEATVLFCAGLAVTALVRARRRARA
jgi:multicomponent Na+:H+ antiporter subunit A